MTPNASAHTRTDSALDQLHAQNPQALPYSGDVTPAELFSYIQQNEAVLVDVRTVPEWQSGVPDTAQTRARLVKLSWKTLPDYALNPNFAGEFSAASIARDTPLFFLCRSGGRSLDAAIAMTAQGYRHCYNVSGGVEGKDGWKASQLPCTQG